MEKNVLSDDVSPENQPSTSSASDNNVLKSDTVFNMDIVHEGQKSDKEMKRLLEETNEILENKAKSMNLSSLNVRSILHHLIKYPSTIDVLLGIKENDDLPSVRNTRSRKKPDENGHTTSGNTTKKFALRIEDKRPKNFLDLEYEEDDEYDDDYIEEKDSELRNGDEMEESDDDEMFDDEEEEEEGGSGENCDEEVEFDESNEKAIAEAETSVNVPNDELDDLLFGEINEFQSDELYSMNMTLNDTRPGSAAMLHTLDNVVDDDAYRSFLMSVQCPPEEWVPDFEQQTVYDTEDDTEDEDYNVIADNLNVEDWDETRQDKTTLIPRHEVKALMMDTLLAEKEIPINIVPEETIQVEEAKKSQKDKDAEVCERIHFSATSSSDSCSLLKQTSVTFRPEELDQLKLQLEQHVQLLTQFVVTCHHDDALAHVRNSAQLMINELDDVRQRAVYVPTVFDVDNLDAAIESCHDINAFPPVDVNLLHYANNTDGHGGTALRPEAAVVLSRSKAIRFPGLLPPSQPVFIHKPIPFLHEENVMLAIALLQFAHLPRRSEKEFVDRYTMIHRHCLPARDAYKIRTHLKSMRRISKNPIHEIIQAAENGISKIILPSKKWKRTDTPIYTWPAVSQPGWFRQFKKIFNVTEDRRIHRKNEAIMLLTPSKIKEKCEEKIPGSSTEQHGIDDSDFLNLGNGPDGRTIIMEKFQMQVLMDRLIQEEKASPSKRRKNPTPMKLSKPVELVQESDDRPQDKQNQKSSKATTPLVSNISSDAPSKAARRLDCSRESNASTFSPDYPGALRNQQNSQILSSIIEDFDDPVTFRNVPNRQISKSPRAGLAEIPLTPGTHQFDSNSCHSFPIPPTPGRRSPDEHDDYFMDLETNSLMWTRTSNAVTEGNPPTPRGYSLERDEADPVDFSSMASPTGYDAEDFFYPSTSQRPMGYSTERVESSNSLTHPEMLPSSASNISDPEPVVEDDTSMPGLDLVPVDDEAYEEERVAQIPVKRALVESRPPMRFKKEIEAGNVNLKASRKRTRLERETMGIEGLDNESLHEKQKDMVMRKVIEDINQRLFMHKDTYERFKTTITNNELSDIEKVSRVILILANYPELLNLVLLYAPSEAVISDFECNTNYQSYKAAIQMMMDIARYITAAKLKEPSLRSLFLYIQNFLKEDPDMTDEQATKRFYQLFGQDRPLWEKLENHFWCLPFKRKPRIENFEYVDLTGMEKMTKREKRDWNSIPSRFETIDNIDQVMGYIYRPPKNDPPSNLVVKAGEMCIQKGEESFIQLEIAERHWTRKDDLALLTSYNEASKTIPDFNVSRIPSIVPDLPFGEKSIIARLEYLLEELKTIEED